MPAVIANAGCSIGVQTADGVRVLVVPRRDLPFHLKLHTSTRTPDGKGVFVIQNFGIPSIASGSAVVACIVPLDAQAVREARATIEKSPVDAWRVLLDRASRQGIEAHEALADAPGTVLRKVTFPKARLVKSVQPKSSATDNPRFARYVELPVINVTAAYNYAVISYNSFTDFLNNYGEPVIDYYIDDEWSQACEDYNEAYWNWYYTKDQVSLAAMEMADVVQAYIDGVSAANNNLAAAECEYKAGYNWCIDYWIARCMVGTVMGDCRGPEAEADGNSSRLQIYLKTTSTGVEDMEFTYAGTWKWSLLSCLAGNCQLEYLKDSATYMPEGSIRIENDNGNGSFEVVVDARTSACPSFEMCPAINTRLYFTKNASGSGYSFGIAGNTSPSIAIKKLVDNTWNIEKVWNEPAGNSVVAFLMGLVDVLNNLKENVPPPDNPNNCQVY